MSARMKVRLGQGMEYGIWNKWMYTFFFTFVYYKCPENNKFVKSIYISVLKHNLYESL